MFVVVRVWHCPAYARGYLRRFLSEPAGGMFVGTCSKRVADNLWARLVEADEDLRVLMVKSSDDFEQGFECLENNLEDGYLREKIDDLFVFGRKLG